MYSMRMQPDDSHSERRAMTPPGDRSTDHKDGIDPVDAKALAAALRKSREEEEKKARNKNSNNNNSMSLLRNDIDHYSSAGSYLSELSM